MPRPIQSGIKRTFRDLNEGETYIEYEASTITVPLRATLPGGRIAQERFKMAAFMRLELFPGYLNNLGTREYQFSIRDCYVCGFSRTLNEIFMGDPEGYLARGTDRAQGREQAVMTFTVHHHYEKHGDDRDEVLGPASTLRIDDVTSHDVRDGNIFWEVIADPQRGGRFRV